MVNYKPFDDYFHDVMLRVHVMKPFMVTGAMGKFNVAVMVSHG